MVAMALSMQTACKKDALNKVPQELISSETFWTSENETRLALNGCYSYLSNGYNYVYDDASSDNAYGQYPWESTATAVSAGNIDATIDLGYKSSYTALRNLNYFLSNVHKVQMDETLKNRFIAEATAIRAFVYFELAKTFGPVPLLKEAYENPETVAVAPNPVEEVIAFSLSELEKAAELLPANYAGGKNNEKGRITAGAALALKSRIELHYSKWAAAAESAKKVMNMDYALFRVSAASPADLKADYSAFINFANDAEKQAFYKGLASYEQQFWAVNENSKEVILSSQNIDNSSYLYGNGTMTLFSPSALGGWSSVTPTQELVNAYWDRSGKPFTPPTPAQRAANYNDGKPNAAYYNEFKDRDTRLYASILFPSNPWESMEPGYKFTWGRGGNNNSKTGYNFRKLVDPLYSKIEWDGAQDFAIIRYAEVLLNYAEAQNELSGPDASIYAALNDIRDRAGMPEVDQNVYNTKESLRQLIRNERRIELAAEGHRMADIRRWNIAKDVMKNTYDLTNSLAQERFWEEKFKLMPYPQSAVDKNPNLRAAQAAKGY